jgi:chromosome segregation ATPase
MRVTADSDRMCIEGNQKDNHELAGALADKREETAYLDDKLSHMNEVSDGQSADIDRGRGELDAKTHVNASLRDDLKRLEGTLHDERVNNSGLRFDLGKAQDCLKNKDHEYSAKRDILDALEGKQDDLSRILADKDTEFVERSKLLDDLDKELYHLNHIYNVTCEENKKLDGQLGRQLADNDKLCRANVDENGRNADHNGHLLSLEAKLREKDDHLHILHKDADGLKAALDRSQIHKEDLSDEIAALNRHVSTVDDQNRRLADELIDLTERDAQIRAALDRRPRVKDLAQINEYLLKDSLNNLQDVRTRSPCRRKKNADHEGQSY